MELSPEKKMAIQALALGNMAQQSAADFVSSMRFIFREIQLVDKSLGRSFQSATKKIRKKDPSISNENLFEKIIRQKSMMAKLIKRQRKKEIFYQLLILQISAWMKSCYKMHSSTLADRSGKTPDKWAKKFLEVGPRYQKLPWAESMSIASNYVRHKEEWHFDSITVDSQTKKFSRRKNIIESLDGDLPKKNAGYLLKLGVSEEVLFGSFFEASTEILELIQSLDSKDLEENCKNWLVALNKYVEKELWKLI